MRCTQTRLSDLPRLPTARALPSSVALQEAEHAYAAKASDWKQRYKDAISNYNDLDYARNLNISQGGIGSNISGEQVSAFMGEFKKICNETLTYRNPQRVWTQHMSNFALLLATSTFSWTSIQMVFS